MHISLEKRLKKFDALRIFAYLCSRISKLQTNESHYEEELFDEEHGLAGHVCYGCQL